jgi:hypothetical protein
MMASESALVRRLDGDFASHGIWRGGLDAALPDLLGEIDILAKGLQLVRDRMEDDDAAQERYGALLGEVRAVTRRLLAAGDALRAALQPGEDAVPAVPVDRVARQGAEHRRRIRPPRPRADPS